MANLIETETYDAGIYQLETSDPVIGGADGKSNMQAKGLANRTKWLKAQYQALLTALQNLASSKVDKVMAVDPGTIALLGGQGELIDSELFPSDFDAAGAAATVQGNLNTHAAASSGTHGQALVNSRKCDNTFDNAATSRSNLGLGNAATLNIGEGVGNVLVAGANMEDENLFVQTNDPSGLKTITNSQARTIILGVDLLCKIMNIGDWNMDAINTVSIAHGISGGKSKIISIEASIYDDFNNYGNNLLGPDGTATWDDTNVHLFRTADRTFDSATYDATSYNRGRILIKYTP